MVPRATKLSFFINNRLEGIIVTIYNSLNLTIQEVVHGDKFSDIIDSEIVNRSEAA